MHLQRLVTWGMLATAALLFVGALPTAQASPYGDATGLACSRLPAPAGSVCIDMSGDVCGSLEGPEGLHPQITRRLFEVARAVRGLPSGGTLAGIIDDEAKVQSGVKFC